MAAGPGKLLRGSCYCIWDSRLFKPEMISARDFGKSLGMLSAPGPWGLVALEVSHADSMWGTDMTLSRGQGGKKVKDLHSVTRAQHVAPGPEDEAEHRERGDPISSPRDSALNDLRLSSGGMEGRASRYWSIPPDNGR